MIKLHTFKLLTNVISTIKYSHFNKTLVISIFIPDDRFYNFVFFSIDNIDLVIIKPYILKVCSVLTLNVVS